MASQLIGRGRPGTGVPPLGCGGAPRRARALLDNTEVAQGFDDPQAVWI